METAKTANLIADLKIVTNRARRKKRKRETKMLSDGSRVNNIYIKKELSY